MHSRRHSHTSSISISLPQGAVLPVTLPRSPSPTRRASLFLASSGGGHGRGHSRVASRSLSHARGPSALKLGRLDREPQVLGVEHGPGTSAATFHPTNAHAWVDESDSDHREQHPFSLSHLSPLPPSGPAPVLETTAVPLNPVRGQPPDPANATHTRRASRHLRQDSIVTKRQSMEVMGGVGMGLAPLGPPHPDASEAGSQGADKRSSVRRSGVLDAAVLFGASSRTSLRLSSHRRTASRFDLAGVPEIDALIGEDWGDRKTALQKLEGQPVPPPRSVPVSILKSPRTPQRATALAEPSNSSGSGRQSSLPKRVSRLRFSLPPPSPGAGGSSRDGAPQQVDQRGSRSSVQLPEFEELHGADGMDERRSSRLLEANEKSTASENKADPAFHPPVGADEGLDTLVEEEEGEDEEESKRAKRPLPPPSKDSGKSPVAQSQSRSGSRSRLATYTTNETSDPRPNTASSPFQMSAQERRALVRQSLPSSAPLRMLRLAPSASTSRLRQSAPDTSSSPGPIGQRRLSGLTYHKACPSAPSPSCISAVGTAVAPVGADAGAPTVREELRTRPEQDTVELLMLQRQLEQAQSQAQSHATTLTGLGGLTESSTEAVQPQIAQLEERLFELQAALQKAQDQSLEWRTRAGQAEAACQQAQGDAAASQKAVSELESTLADTTAERDTYLEDVDGWRQRCGDLEASLSSEKERGQAEALCRAVLAGKAQRLLKRLDRAGVSVPDEDRLSARELLPPTHARGDASPNLSAGRSVGSTPGGPWSGTSPRLSPRGVLSPLLDPAHPHPPAEETIKLLADMRQQIFTLAATLKHEKQRRVDVEQQLERSRSFASPDKTSHDASGTPILTRPQTPVHAPADLRHSPARSTSPSFSLSVEAGTDPVFHGDPPRSSSPLGSEADGAASPLGPVPAEFICPADMIDVTVSDPSRRRHPAQLPHNVSVTSGLPGLGMTNVFQIGSADYDFSSPMPQPQPLPPLLSLVPSLGQACPPQPAPTAPSSTKVLASAREPALASSSRTHSSSRTPSPAPSAVPDNPNQQPQARGSIDIEVSGFDDEPHGALAQAGKDEVSVPQVLVASASPEVRTGPTRGHEAAKGAAVVSVEYSGSSLPSWRDSHGTSSPGSESQSRGVSSPPEEHASSLVNSSPPGPVKAAEAVEAREDTASRRSDDLFPALTWSFSSATSKARQKALAAQAHKQTQTQAQKQTQAQIQVRDDAGAHDFFGIDTELGLPPLTSSLSSLDLPPVPLTGVPMHDNTRATRYLGSHGATETSLLGMTSNVLTGLGGYLLARPSAGTLQAEPPRGMLASGSGVARDHHTAAVAAPSPEIQVPVNSVLPATAPDARLQGVDTHATHAPAALAPTPTPTPGPRRLVPRMGVTQPPALVATPRETLDFAPLTEGAGAWPVFAV